jgi:N6-L-threonylcarbamoyladenine synthase
LILAFETSCDETAAACISQEGDVMANVVSSQADLHARYGGVVPEVASRRHLELIEPVALQALDDAGASLADVELVAATQGPGLVGALLVGLSFAKALAWSARLPFTPVDHLHGHVASLFLGDEQIEPPFLCLLASGGHTLILDVVDHRTHSVVGRSIDDAAGEAFDKGARMLGLGYPGGGALDELARAGDPAAYAFPVARVPGHDLSFSGVKTALYYATRDLDDAQLVSRRADLAASYEHAIVTALVRRFEHTAEDRGIGKLAVVGGVAANSELRRRLSTIGATLAPISLCTDNAAMIASAARYASNIPFPDYGDVDAYPSA